MSDSDKQRKPLSFPRLFDGFSRWLNANKDDLLDPFKYCVSYVDIDKVIYRLSPTARAPTEVLLFLLEVKSHGAANVSANHQKLFNLLDAVLMRLNGLAFPNRVSGLVQFRYYGFHYLVMSGDSPDDSEWMDWDGNPIERGELIEILRLQRNPRTREEFSSVA